MDIGTAKPTKEEQAMCPHHLIDIKEANEDFVELIAIYVTSTAAEWNETITKAYEGREKILAKFDIVYNYMLNSWNIDLDELRDVIQRRQGEIDTLDLENL